MVNLPAAGAEYHVPFGVRKGFQPRPPRTRNPCPGILSKNQDDLCSMMTNCIGVLPLVPKSFHDDGMIDTEGMRSVPDCLIDQGAAGQGARCRLDPSRFRAAPLITQCAASEMSDEHRPDRQVQG